MLPANTKIQWLELLSEIWASLLFVLLVGLLVTKIYEL